MNSIEPPANFNTLSQVIRSRKTMKIIARDSQLPEIESDLLVTFDNRVLQALEVAGWAPFHFDRQRDGVPEPWRVHFFRQPVCREIAQQFENWFDDVKPGNKLPGLLRGCWGLLVVNWLPQNAVEIPDDAKRNQINLEHHAASAAFVQNLLLLLTSLGLENYWSSGGQLATETFFEKFHLNADEKLIAAIFISPPTADEAQFELVPGKLRNQRSNWRKWTFFSELGSE